MSRATTKPRPAKASAAKKQLLAKVPETNFGKPERKAGRVVAKRMRLADLAATDGLVDCFVLPADAASVERMQDQGYHAAVAESDLPADVCQRITCAVLASFGIAATGKGERK